MSAHTLCRHCKIEYHAGNIVYCHLHAAAPAMLEALEEMVIYAEGVPGEGFAKARAAIKLARGGE
jgi:hypothetical protein